MKLYIAEKPSLGRAIADVLPKPHQRQEGCIRVGNGDVVSWCIGHLLELAEPAAYDPVYKAWRLEHLPIVPTQWQLTPKSKTKKQLTVLRKLVKEAHQIVHAGDPDREGQLLVDEVINYLGVSDAKRQQIQRCLISDLNPAAVRQALQNLKSNQDFAPLSRSALARSRADWLYGINLTRAYTLQGKKVGYDGVLSVGRVQTPVLGLVVRRDQAVAEFVAKPFYDVWAHVQTPRGEVFKAKWRPSEACRSYQDEEGRVLLKALAENVVARITDKPAQLIKLDQKRKRQAPPLPYNLSALQIDAGNRYGMTAKQVLDTCQQLYERHKLITYPRSDCRYLPKDHHRQGATLIAVIGDNDASLQAAAARADPALKSKTWNDAKVTAHHAIIPTGRKLSVAQLHQDEQRIYYLIARHYLAQFYPDYEYFETRIELRIEGGLFVATARQPLDPGWKALFAQATQRDQAEEPVLPAIECDDILHCKAGELVEKMTQPPLHFTDASLLAAMTGIARFVDDPSIRKILKETDGLGTEATRAGIIALLVQRGFIERTGKQLRATDTGQGLIASLPVQTTQPDMTAQWESQLDAICQRQARYQDFMAQLTESLAGLIVQAQQTPPRALPNQSRNRRKAVALKRRKARKRTAV